MGGTRWCSLTDGAHSPTGQRRAPGSPRINRCCDFVARAFGQTSSALRAALGHLVAKMDIEGAERLVLQENIDWMNHVGEIQVECHQDLTPFECASLLERAGLSVRITSHRQSIDTVLGVR